MHISCILDWIIGLLDYWIIGLLDYWIIGFCWNFQIKENVKIS
jgi:hypothetical protein